MNVDSDASDDAPAPKARRQEKIKEYNTIALLRAAMWYLVLGTGVLGTGYWVRCIWYGVLGTGYHG